MTSVMVYGRPGCVQCKYTCKRFDDLGVPYEYIDLTHFPDIAQHMRETYGNQLPFVVTSDDAWQGFKIDKIKGLVKTAIAVA